MNISDIHLLYDYNDWANQLIIDHAAQLDPSQLMQANNFSWGSLFGTLVHTMDSEHLWRNLCQRGVIVERLTPEDFPTLDALVTFWQAEQAEMRAYLATLHDKDMASIISYDANGTWRERVLWHCLVHVVNHGTQHRSESAVMLTDFGHSPDGLDLTRYLNTRVEG